MKWLWREDRSKKADWLLGITFSKLKKDLSQWTGNEAKVAGSLHRWASSSWQNSNVKKEVYRRWKEEQVAQEEYMDTVWVCKDQVRENKTIESNLVRGVRGTRPSARTSPAKERPQRICKHSDEWVSWSCVREEQTGQGTQCLLHLGLKAWLSSRNPRCLRPVWKFQSKEDLPSVEEGWIRDYINTWTYMSPWDWWDTLTWWIEVTFISMPGKVG